ncbi:MAG: hypothetical protein M5U18_00860 [Dehalococcoidia bacterium]|nr:hypothetical protein [Dehalococcoidia bacterium]
MKQDNHAHYWTIESPAGESRVSGRCKVCGKERAFAVSLDLPVRKYYGGGKRKADAID